MSRFLLSILLFLVIVAVITVLAVIFVPIHRSGPSEQLPVGYQVPEGRGKYVAQMADCTACHTPQSGEPFAGGNPIGSPFGSIYASNITPSQAGIAGWTLDNFRAALQDGVRPDGKLLYPAMPYDSYRKIREEDIVALYNYFMNEVKPVNTAVMKTSLIFPFNQRWGIRIWNWLALPGKPGYEPRFGNAKLDRGAYLIETLGHCGFCHTPRDFMLKQAGTDSTSPAFLTGETLSGWYGPDLRGADSALTKWDSDDLRQYLMTGRNRYAAATGPMTVVIADSLQYATSEDVDAMVAYLEKIGTRKPAPPVTGKPDATTTLLSAAKPDMPLGARLFLDNCNACHQVTGRGAAGIFPELDGAPIVTARDPSGLIEIILDGARMPSTPSRPADIAMPGFGWRLQDDEVAALVNFLRSAWSNRASSSVTAKDVAKIRTHPIGE